MAESTMEEVINLEGELQPCGICGRTFLPAPLLKHTKFCERNASKKRKIFDSHKQRIEGTELASFHHPHVKKHVTGAPYTADVSKKVKWKEKHLELVQAIRAARGAVDTGPPSSIAMNNSHDTSGGDRCPSCDRQFGPRAYERHVEWCKERVTRIHRSPADVLLAKERLEARIKYRVPPPKSKRSIVKEKYSPLLGSRTESLSSIKSASCTYLDQSPSLRKHKPIVTLKKLNEIPVYDHGDSVDAPHNHTDKLRKSEKVKKVATKDSKIINVKPVADPTKSDTQPDYNPFLTAERQLMELLECDDFQPFISKPSKKVTNRPHTVNTTKTKQNDIKHNNKVIKSAENTRKKVNENGESTKRASVIDPPTDFQDADDFELIESLINQNYLESYDTISALNDIQNDKVSSKENLYFSSNHDNSSSVYDNKFIDDLSIIDPRLINKNDNLKLPDNLVAHHSSSDSSNDNFITAENVMDQIKSSRRQLNYFSEKLHHSSSSTHKNFIQSNKVIKPINRVQRLTKPKKLTKTSTNKSSISLTSSSSNKNVIFERKKSLSTMKISSSFQESSKSNLALKEDTEAPLETKQKPSKPEQKRSCTDDLMIDELFSVDDEMYEEYKKYEEMYLKEKQEQQRMEQKKDSFDSCVDNNLNSSVNSDSAYNSLNRNNQKVRAKPNTLTPLEYVRPQTSPLASPASSGSDTTPAVQPSTKRIPKFCHECGSEYPISTAKFCIECGVKRLVL